MSHLFSDCFIKELRCERSLVHIIGLWDEQSTYILPVYKNIFCTEIVFEKISLVFREVVCIEIPLVYRDIEISLVCRDCLLSNLLNWRSPTGASSSGPWGWRHRRPGFRRPWPWGCAWRRCVPAAGTTPTVSGGRSSRLSDENKSFVDKRIDE